MNDFETVPNIGNFANRIPFAYEVVSGPVVIEYLQVLQVDRRVAFFSGSASQGIRSIFSKRNGSRWTN